MKRIVTITIAIFVLLCGCSYQMPLSQSGEDIAKIELINEKEVHPILCTLTGEDAEWFMKELLQLTCNRNLQPLGEIGYLQVHIYYENGEVDFIGCVADGYIKDGEQTINGWYYFKEVDLLDLFSAYMDR